MARLAAGLLHRQQQSVLELAPANGRRDRAHQFGQFLFFHQWADLRRYARDRGVRLIGDVPIFVSGDSADVWANPKLYLLDGALRPKVVAGVPPDYFSKTGQLWGNPHYDWAAMAETGYAWWVARLKATLEHVDLVRLDHFRGFGAAWQIPAGEKTAERGEWVVGPGMDFFRRLRLEFGHDLPLIAEDLGEITPDVYALRDDLGLPGMKILQFAFEGPKNPFLPHNYVANCVTYSGTHDNDTTRGWWTQAPDNEKHYFRLYTGRDGSDVAWDLIRLAWASVADYAIAPVQDVLDLPTEERMNLPGKGEGNWRYRMREGAFNDQVVHRLRELTEVYGRLGMTNDQPGCCWSLVIGHLTSPPALTLPVPGGFVPVSRAGIIFISPGLARGLFRVVQSRTPCRGPPRRLLVEPPRRPSQPHHPPAGFTRDPVTTNRPVVPDGMEFSRPASSGSSNRAGPARPLAGTLPIRLT